MDNGASSYRRFLDGNDDSFVEIIRDYKDGLMLYINGYVGNIHVAEDLMQETFVRIVLKKPRFSGKSSFKSWLYAIGRNIAVDYIRKCARNSVILTDDITVLSRDEESVEKEYLRDERKILLHRVMKRLNPDYRKVLYLIYFEDIPMRDAASLMKKSYKQTDNLIYRAKQSLRSELEKEDFVYEDLL